MRRVLLVALAAIMLGVGLAGCKETISTTAVSEDGSVVKVITVKTNSNDPMASMGGAEEVKLSDLVKLEGSGWVVTETEAEDGTKTFRAERKVSGVADSSAGWSLKLSNESRIRATTGVREVEGYWMFEERYALEGTRDEAKRALELAELSSKLKANWLNGELTDAQAVELAEKVRLATMRVVFGPSEPILPIIFTSPARFEREFKLHAYAAITPLFVGVNGLGLPDAQAQAKKLIEVMNAESSVEKPSPDDEEEGDETESYSISVSFRGPVIKEHNGRLDPVSDEVFWDFYSMAVEEAPVTLMVRCRG